MMTATPGMGMPDPSQMAGIPLPSGDLPEGTLVVIDTAGIAAVFNSEDQDLWPD